MAKRHSLRVPFLLVSQHENKSTTQGSTSSTSLTGIEPVWFEIENSLPYCVEKA